MVCDAVLFAATAAAAAKCASASCIMYASVRMSAGADVVTNDPDERKREQENEKERDQNGKKPTFEQRLQNDCGL